MKRLCSYFKDFIGLIYPQLCLCCFEDAPVKDNLFCLECDFHLPRTDQFSNHHNDFKERLLGRLDIKYAASYLYNYKSSRVQQMLHALKYQGKKEIANFIGQQLGLSISQYWINEPPELMLPVPLHTKKQHWRGYNQSEELAKGILESTGIPIVNNALIKVMNNDSQTAKSREERLQNVQLSFNTSTHADLSGRHVLLVDDVVTSGATLEACAHLCKQSGAKTISMTTLAMAM